MTNARKKTLRMAGSFAVIGGLVLYVLSACGTLAGNPEEDEEESPKSMIAFDLTDAPVDAAAHVFVTIARLEISPKDGEWIDIPLKATQEVDLLALQGGGKMALAALDEVPVGTYTQTRLALSPDVPPRIVLTDGTEAELKVPSGQQTGLKIKTPYTLVQGETLQLTIDFDLRKSIVAKGSEGYLLKPTLRLVETAKTGKVEGSGEDGTVACAYSPGVEPDPEMTCAGAINSAAARDGAFVIAFLPEGTYKVRVYPPEGDPRDSQVTVKAGESTQLPE